MTRHQDKKDNEDYALYVPCSQVQLARVVVCVLVLVDVVCVMLVVLIARVDVVRAVDTVFVAIFCSWRCTLYRKRSPLGDLFFHHPLCCQRCATKSAIRGRLHNHTW